MAIKKLSNGEQATLSVTVDVDKQFSQTIHTVKPDASSPVRYNLVWNFDWTGVAQKEMIELAERTIRIRKQSDWRKSKDAMNEENWDNVTFKVRDILDNARRTADPVQKAEKAIAKLTKAEREALLKALQA